MAEKLFSGSKPSPSKQLVVNGAISIGKVDVLDFEFFKLYLWMDWYTKEGYTITYDEFLSIKPYPESPIPEPGWET